jgi:hypothetical protein
MTSPHPPIDSQIDLINMQFILIDLINMQMTLINMYIVLICKLVTAQTYGAKRRHMSGQRGEYGELLIMLANGIWDLIRRLKC